MPAWLKKYSNDKNSSNEDAKEEEDDKEKEASPTVVLGDQSQKRFQTQVESLKILKGAGLENPAPCKKQTGFLSIESANKMTYVIFRTLTGKPLYKGILSKSAKVRLLTEADGPKFAT